MRKRGYFEGWYYKHQVHGRSLAVIPGRAEDGAFIQVVTGGRAYFIPYPLSEYQKQDRLRIGSSVFSHEGIHLDIRHHGVGGAHTVLWPAFSGLHLRGAAGWVRVSACYLSRREDPAL
jgi:hypothetical protein